MKDMKTIYNNNSYVWASLGMIVNVIVPVVFLMTCTTWFCDMLATDSPLIFRISSPECSLPSSATMLFGAMLRMKTGLSPRVELAPPTMLNPRLAFPDRWRVIVCSTGLCVHMQENNVVCDHVCTCFHCSQHVFLKHGLNIPWAIQAV